MRRLRLVILTAALVIAGCARGESPLEAGAEAPHLWNRDDGPIFIVDSIRGNIWGPTPADKLPNVVVYADGTVIIQRWTEERFEYLTSVLTPTQIAALSQLVDVPALEEFDGADFQLTTATDAGRLLLYARKAQGGSVCITAYGSKLPASSKDRPPSYPPPPVENALRVLTSYSDPDAVRWTPPEFEVYIWECDQFRSETPTWPSDWPEPRSPQSSDRWHTVRIRGEESIRLTTLLGSPVESHPRQVAHKGRVWCVDYRPVFPDEERWRLAHTIPVGSPN